MNDTLVVLILVTLFSIFLRWTTSLNSYSGEKKPPMYGDYEAQRHWQEITLNLPVSEWYVNSTQNDLLYWGLDYPPLTAYHSLLCGHVAKWLNPEWVSLFTSRGYESQAHKLFMRYSVLVVDILLYIPAVLWLLKITLANSSSTRQICAAGLVLSYPGLILIDHGHFQYNCVSLGFALLAICCMLKDLHVFGSVFFVLALNYKQMELYHAFPFFFYLLGVCIKQKNWFHSIVKLASIGIAVVATFVICWLPFLSSVDSVLAVVERMFPFGRGLFEDKVANFWCALSIVVKIKNIFSQPQIVKLCLVTTLLACLPSSFDLLRNPTKKKFMYSMVNCSLAFFLFSYQVHEKSILIVAIPVCTLLMSRPLETVWFLNISTFSMFPLLQRDGQTITYIALSIIFLVMAVLVLDVKEYGAPIKSTFLLSHIGCLLIHLLAATLPAPSRFPDIYPLLFSVYSCLHFLVFLVWSNVMQYQCSNQDLSYTFTDGTVKQKAN